MDMERTPALAKLDMLLIIEIILVSEKDCTAFSNQGRKLLALLLGQLRELDTVELGAELGGVVDPLGDTGKKGFLLGVGALAGDAGRERVAIGQGCVLVVGREDDVVFGDKRSHCCFCVFMYVVVREKVDGSVLD